MRTKLAIIALSSFAISAVCLGGAYALGGNQVGNAVFNLDNIGWQERCDPGDAAHVTGDTLSLSWDGNGEKASVAFPANIHYQAGVGDLLVVKGDPAIISHVRVHDGEVDLDCRNGSMGRNNRIDVTLPGKRTFQKFEMLGSGDMQLSGLSQPEAKVEVAGSGTVETDGKVDRLDLEVSGSGAVQSKGQTDDLHVDVNGSGKMQLGDLVARDVHVDISGSGKVDLAPQDSLNVDISGSGTIYLHSEPKTMETDISGSGRIIHPNGTVQDRHEQHAELEKADRHHTVHVRAPDGAAINAIVEEALRSGQGPDPDKLQAAIDRLHAKIREKVADDLNKADNDNDR